jgi:peptide/nickel transport system permease protein
MRQSAWAKMLAFVLRRLVQAVIVMLTVAFIAFMLFQYVGDPVTNILGQDATPEQRQQLRADLGLDKPFPVQFARFVGNAVQGEFGLSLRQGRKVSSLIAERLPATLELSLVAASSRSRSAFRWASTPRCGAALRCRRR